MYEFQILLIFIGMAATLSGNDFLIEVYKDMNIIPNDMEKPPDGYIRIVYDENFVMENGIEIKPSQAKEPPIIDWNAAINNYYTLIMVCADAPNRKNPHLREWVHWVVGNIPGTNLSMGEVICPHSTVMPGKDMGLLRYVFFIFQQNDRIVFDEPQLNNTSGEGHVHFHTMKFAKKYRLGRPIASMAFLAQWDEYVPKMLEQFHIEESDS